MHDEGTATVGVSIFESFIVNRDAGIEPKGFEDVKNGSWMIKAKVEDDAIWSKVKDGTYKGFSVEGIFRQVPVKMSKVTPDAIANLLSTLSEEEQLQVFKKHFAKS